MNLELFFYEYCYIACGFLIVFLFIIWFIICMEVNKEQREAREKKREGRKGGKINVISNKNYMFNIIFYMWNWGNWFYNICVFYS